ncbi:MAG: hypothetical protein JWQ96_1310 [Segetibacter sp.]|nr:hypothetical protein [Segetibacter sp.]
MCLRCLGGSTYLMALNKQILSFLFNLDFNVELPEGFEVMHPFKDAETQRVSKVFYDKFYNDDNKRFCVIGINPGRFGAGVTGVPFTDPIRLEKECGIANDWPKKQELSSLFVYDLVHAYGGVEKFYRKFYITAVSPLGLVKGGKNINYYDDKKLQQSVKPFAVDCLRKQLAWGLETKAAFCLGEGKNAAYVQKLNDEYGFFEKIVPLPHPRFIMQYKLKQKQDYIDKYLNAFKKNL